jgi:hypothetical protein
VRRRDYHAPPYRAQQQKLAACYPDWEISLTVQLDGGAWMFPVGQTWQATRGKVVITASSAEELTEMIKRVTFG